MSELQNQQTRLRDIGELTFGKRMTEPSTDIEALSEVQPPLPLGQRQHIGPDMKMSAWRKVANLLITADDGSEHLGTAFFISARTLVTAGHCLFVYKPGSVAHGMVRTVLVMPARDGETDAVDSPFGWAEVSQDNLLVHPNWLSGDINFDYGAIVLPAAAPAIGAQTGWFGYDRFADDDLKDSTPTLSGYPDDAPLGTQWYETNVIKKVTSRRVFYTIHTADGQSGSPVFFPNGPGEIACAIHNWGDVTLNSGVRINQEVIDQLNAWKVN